MKTLYLDTTSETTEVVIINDGLVAAEEKWASGHNLGNNLLPKINQLVDDWQKIDAIVVNPGPGSFTGTRIGVVTVNALAWAHNISVIAGNFELAKRHPTKSSGYSNPVEAKYDRPASVTLKKP